MPNAYLTDVSRVIHGRTCWQPQRCEEKETVSEKDALIIQCSF